MVIKFERSKFSKIIDPDLVRRENVQIPSGCFDPEIVPIAYLLTRRSAFVSDITCRSTTCPESTCPLHQVVAIDAT